jgi:hypothetical protein
MPTCYARNVQLGSQVWFQPGKSEIFVGEGSRGGCASEGGLDGNIGKKE